MRFALTLLVLQIFAHPVCAQWVFQTSGTTSRLRGVSAVSERIAWVSGTGGAVLLTVDGGKTWDRRIVPDASELDFRDIEAFDNRTAYALSIGEGSRSRIYKTVDGGTNWALQHTNSDPKGFLYKQPDRAGNVCALTSDGGRTWRLPKGSRPTGYRSAITRVPDSPGPTLVAVGATGTDRSTDGGENWTKLGGDGFHAAAMTQPKTGWAVGEQGRIARWNARSQKDHAP